AGKRDTSPHVLNDDNREINLVVAINTTLADQHYLWRYVCPTENQHRKPPISPIKIELPSSDKTTSFTSPIRAFEYIYKLLPGAILGIPTHSYTQILAVQTSNVLPYILATGTSYYAQIISRATDDGIPGLYV
ncbi:16519_t:CDS:2, partial [Gigaspora rosea]